MRVIVLALCSLVLGSCQSQDSKITFANNSVIAHRGAWKAQNLPENSIASLKHAIALNCAGSEFDVRMTADDSLIVTHDPTYAGMDIEETSYMELAKEKLANGEILPTLAMYLDAGMSQNKSTALICEIKPSKIEGRNTLITKKVLDLVAEKNAQDHIGFYISFSYDILKQIKQQQPEAKVQYLDGSKSPEALAKDHIDGLDYYKDVFKKHPEWIVSAKAKNQYLNAWTVNEVEDIDWLLAEGFHFITTNEPELVFERAAVKAQE